jgi:hypothetical protein
VRGHRHRFDTMSLTKRRRGGKPPRTSGFWLPTAST